MICEWFEKEGDSSRGMYIRSTSDIPPNWEDMRSIADIPKLCAIEKCIWVRKNESENN